ncbi:hypothetical protein BCR33DRAFT_713042 [Rhizoclosmatium globosum]|uniref:Uncharacterized protein n=1 Tax=Rhizoclosmatium globosum TaxID=329046 RepID=A0A1Y2CVR2_9FUNG|nr:hypothetical protein BCR33DRAFT_713042 [Rhizoclosmatium globosum]|eukprot:ORY51130.1 hypothetical protein BCR33DRAFT_713042 [Rhizoclosmatium globosum]
MASTTLLPFESYYGAILNRDDVTLLVEACIAGLATSFTTVPRKVQVRSGSVVAFREREDGARWRDSNRWSPSKVQGCFLQYQEVEVGPWGKRIKTDGLIKRTLTVIGSDGGRWRVIGYFRQKDLGKVRSRKSCFFGVVYHRAELRGRKPQFDIRRKARTVPK